jgi:hypothetical protein
MNKRSNVDNLDIIPFAVFKLGGVGVFVDVEDVFVCSYKLAPERFGWRKHRYPNYKILSKALRDFESRYPNYLIKTADGLSRQLSAEGLEWLKDRLTDFERALNVPGVNPPVRRPIQRMLNDLANNPFVQRFLAGEMLDVRKHEVADVLLCSPDAHADVFRERMQTYRAAAKHGGRLELLRFLDYLCEQYSDWFGG